MKILKYEKHWKGIQRTKKINKMKGRKEGNKTQHAEKTEKWKSVLFSKNVK